MGEWQPTQLDKLIDIKHGFAFKGEFFSDEPANDLLLTPGNFAIGGGFQWGKGKFYRGPVPNDYVLSPGDLLVTMTDLSKQADTLGYPALMPRSDYRLLHNQRLGKITLKSKNTRLSFINWRLRAPDYRNEVLASCTGSTVKHTSPKKILAFEFLLPPLYEQEAIADLLSALDDKIELNRRTNETLEALARSLFKDWFVDFGPARAKAEGRPPYLAPELWDLFPDALDDEDKPMGWTWEPPLALADLISGGTPKTSEPKYWDGGIRWASAKDVSNCGQAFLLETERTITNAGLNNSSTRIIPALSSVVVARGATTGRFCMFGTDIAMNQTCYALRAQDSFHYFL